LVRRSWRGRTRRSRCSCVTTLRSAGSGCGECSNSLPQLRDAEPAGQQGGDDAGHQ
jgi:hypothetical protein